MNELERLYYNLGIVNIYLRYEEDDKKIVFYTIERNDIRNKIDKLKSPLYGAVNGTERE